MGETLTERIRKLEREIRRLTSKVRDLSRNVEESAERPYSKVGGGKDGSHIRSLDIGTGLGQTMGGNFVWNDSELILPPYGQQPSEPTKGYNKHGHSRYAGGALDINTLELVEFETNISGQIVDKNGSPLNKHCQQFWENQPRIAKDGIVDKIGNLDIEFNPTTRKWEAGAKYIDVEKTYFVQYVWKKAGEEVPEGTEGATREIKKDGNGVEMKSPLLVVGDDAKTNIVWDEDAKCFKLYGVYKEEEE